MLLDYLHIKSGYLSISFLSAELLGQVSPYLLKPCKTYFFVWIRLWAPGHEPWQFSNLDVLGVSLSGAGLKSWDVGCGIQSLSFSGRSSPSFVLPSDCDFQWGSGGGAFWHDYVPAFSTNLDTSLIWVVRCLEIVQAVFGFFQRKLLHM